MSEKSLTSEINTAAASILQAVGEAQVLLEDANGSIGSPAIARCLDMLDKCEDHHAKIVGALLKIKGHLASI